MNKPVFSLEHQYQLYLKRVGLKEAMMHPAQRTETKRAFMGACGQMLVMLRDDLVELPENEAVETLQDLNNQVSNYWLAETKQVN